MSGHTCEEEDVRTTSTSVDINHCAAEHVKPYRCLPSSVSRQSRVPAARGARRILVSRRRGVEDSADGFPPPTRRLRHKMGKAPASRKKKKKEQEHVR